MGESEEMPPCTPNDTEIWRETKMKKFVAMLLAALMLLACGCGADTNASADDSAARIAALEQENAQLKAQIESLTTELGLVNQNAALQDWSLNADAWSDSNGATVTFTAAPVTYVEGMRAALSVRMGDLEAESTNCVWDGSAFTGSVELSAADGYSYYCILTSANGSQEEIELNSPANVTNEMLVNLGSNLSTYANLVVEDWAATASALNIKSGYVQAQLPRLVYNNASSEISDAALVLKVNSEEVGRQDITLEAGEGNSSYEAALSGISFETPAMEDDYQLNLWLEVTLNTGNTLSVSGGSWYSNNGELQLVVG